MLVERLRQYQADGNLVSISRWPDGETILVGRVVEVTSSSARFELIDSLGQLDGELELPLDSIYRLAESPEYMERLRLFSTIVPPIEETKGEVTGSQAVIKRRLREAAMTGECVAVTLLPSDRQHYKVLRVDRESCELELYGDHPLRTVDVTIVRFGQIAKLRWRSSTELAVTAIWRQNAIGATAARTARRC